MEWVLLVIGFFVLVWLVNQIWPSDQSSSLTQQPTLVKAPSHGGARRGQTASTSQDHVQIVLDAALAQLHRIPESTDIFSGTSAKFRKQLSLILGPAYAESLAQLTSQQLEAVRTKMEIEQRAALRITKAGVMRIAAPAIVTAETDTLKQILVLRDEVETLYKGKPEALVLFNGVFGKMIAEVLNDGSPKSLTDAAEVTRLLVGGYAHRELTARVVLKEIEDEMMKGKTPSEIPVAEIFRKYYDTQPDGFEANGSERY
jgi:hypothetical protein